MEILPPRTLNHLIRSSLFFNKIDHSSVRNFEVFMNTVIMYENDHDTRILEFLFQLEPISRSQLAMIFLKDERLHLFWNTPHFPDLFKEGQAIVINYKDGERDKWEINESRNIQDLIGIKDKILVSVTLN